MTVLRSDPRERQERIYRGYRLKALRGPRPCGSWRPYPETEVWVTHAEGRCVMLHLYGKNEEPLSVLLDQLAAWLDRRLDEGDEIACPL